MLRRGEATGTRDLDRIDAAVERPQQGGFGQNFYPTLYLKAAALLQTLAHDHPFEDGNKRTAWTATTSFLEINGHPLDPDFDQDAAFDIVLAVATGELSDIETIATELERFCP